jgi:tetratricopeptide (TPR) repeat protein
MKSILHLLLGLSLAASTLSSQTSPRNPTTDMWNDPDFIKSFTGSYGILAEYEPPISNDEKLVLRSLMNAIRSNPKSAITALEPQIKPKTSAAFDFILANLYFQDGNLANAEKYYNQATRKFPNFRRAYKNLGLVQVQSGNYKAAVKSISKAMELGEVDGRSYGLLGYSYLTQELYYPAETAYRQAILMQPGTLDWKLGLARCLMETERYGDAIALFDTLIKLQPNRADFLLLQGNAYIGKQEPMAAARNIEIVRRMGKAELATLTLLGDIYINNDAPSLALDAYQAALQVANNNDSKSLIRAAEILTRSGSFAEGKTMIRSTRERFGDQLSNANDLKLLTLEAKIARAENDNETALTALKQIIERDALNGEALIELGNIYAAQGDLPKAINRFEQAEKIEAFERKALIAHAQALVANTDYQAALPLLRRALYMQPDNNLEDYVKRVERAARDKRV